MSNSPAGPPNRDRPLFSELPVHDPWVKRNGFSHGGMALIWIFTAFLLFVFFTNILGPLLVIGREGIDISGLDPTAIMNLMMANADLLLLANSLGQIIFLGLATWFFCRLHAEKKERPAFLRFQFLKDTPKVLGITFILMLIIQPVIWFLGWINSFLPLPEVMKSMQMQQMELLKNYLTGDGIVIFALFNIALVPAVCEEVLFRGYVLRSFEKSWGIVLAIIISGIIFGAYHLQLASILPLASIGVLLAYLTWASKSIYPAMLAHFINNGANVLMAKYFPAVAFSELSPETMPPIWLVGISGVASGYLLYWFYKYQQNEPKKRETNVTRS